MAANNVILNKQTLIDLSKDTVSESHVEEGITFHKADGTRGVGIKGKITIKDVYEWPTSNFDENVVYRKTLVLGISNFYYDTDNDNQLIRYDYGIDEINNLLQLGFGAQASVYYRKKVSELVGIDLSNLNSTTLAIAYIAETNTMWLYSDSKWSDIGSSDMVGLLLGIPAADTLTPVYSEIDIVDKGVNTTYVLIKDAYARYIDSKLNIVTPAYGTKVITDDDISVKVDVSNYSDVLVDKVMTYWATSVENLPLSAPIGSIGIVLGGEN